MDWMCRTSPLCHHALLREYIRLFISGEEPGTDIVFGLKEPLCLSIDVFFLITGFNLISDPETKSIRCHMAVIHWSPIILITKYTCLLTSLQGADTAQDMNRYFAILGNVNKLLLSAPFKLFLDRARVELFGCCSSMETVCLNDKWTNRFMENLVISSCLNGYMDYVIVTTTFDSVIPLTTSNLARAMDDSSFTWWCYFFAAESCRKENSNAV